MRWLNLNIEKKVNKVKMLRQNDSLDPGILATVEQYLDFKLPKGYREFILKHNGGEPENKVFYFKEDSSNGSILRYFLSFTPNKYENILVVYRDYRNRIPQNMFPIACDPFGNLVLISIKMADRGKIYFWEHEMEADPSLEEVPDYSNLTLINDSFEEFLNSLRSIEEIEHCEK